MLIQPSNVQLPNIQLHNTLSGQIENFTPNTPDTVKFYVCGPTVYNYIHIGNARPIVVFDVLYRLFKQHFSTVTYARNITDIDDKIIAKAQETNQPISQITDYFTTAFHEDITALGNLPPTLELKATDHLPQMIDLVQTLLSREKAYIADNHVLFDVSAFPEYGKLSNRKLDDLKAGARVEVASYKRHPADFVLWKPAKSNEPGWDSPWGYGRPGWHLECSAMIKSRLGDHIDLHGGGQDLIFPHHENEIAQSECACSSGRTGKPLANFWMHNGYITINAEKMSKSLGNFVTVRELLETHNGDVLRYALLSSHYRSPLNWSDNLIQAAKNNIDRLYQSTRGITPDQTTLASSDLSILKPLVDDLNTPAALTHLHELAHQLNTASDHLKPTLTAKLIANAQLLGLLNQSPTDYFQDLSQTATSGLDPAWIDGKIDERKTARQNKDFALADKVRNELLSKGIELEDGPSGTTWKTL